MKTVGYIRVSSNKQTLEHQRFEIENFARREGLVIDEWEEEKISSRKSLNQRKLGELLNNLQENDILITCEISRLGRSLLEVMKILETCLNKNCQVWTLKENYKLISYLILTLRKETKCYRTSRCKLLQSKAFKQMITKKCKLGIRIFANRNLLRKNKELYRKIQLLSKLAASP